MSRNLATLILEKSETNSLQFGLLTFWKGSFNIKIILHQSQQAGLDHYSDLKKLHCDSPIQHKMRQTLAIHQSRYC